MVYTYIRWKQYPLLPDRRELAGRSFFVLRFLALERLSMELWGMVSSLSIISSFSTSTISGWAEVTKMFWILGYCSLAHQENLHIVLHNYQGVPESPSPEQRGHYHVAKCTFLAVLPQSSWRGCGEWLAVCGHKGTAWICFSLQLSGVGRGQCRLSRQGQLLPSWTALQDPPPHPVEIFQFCNYQDLILDS